VRVKTYDQRRIFSDVVVVRPHDDLFIRVALYQPHEVGGHAFIAATQPPGVARCVLEVVEFVRPDGTLRRVLKTLKMFEHSEKQFLLDRVYLVLVFVLEQPHQQRAKGTVVLVLESSLDEEFVQLCEDDAAWRMTPVSGVEARHD